MVKGGEVRLSKRAGNMITLEDLVDEVASTRAVLAHPVPRRFPVDARSGSAIKLFQRQPVYTTQHAHARISSSWRNAADAGIAWQ